MQHFCQFKDFPIQSNISPNSKPQNNVNPYRHIFPDGASVSKTEQRPARFNLPRGLHSKHSINPMKSRWESVRY